MSPRVRAADGRSHGGWGRDWRVLARPERRHERGSQRARNPLPKRVNQTLAVNWRISPR